MLQKIVILGTGGTIAGLAPDPSRPCEYAAAQLKLDALMGNLPRAGDTMDWVTEQVAQIDSKDMSAAVWRRLLARVVHHLQDPQVSGLVITHGTDTLEETAFLLAAVLPQEKPVILTGAMRPANVPGADGPTNLGDAMAAAMTLPAGVWVVFAGHVHPAWQVQKVHATALNPYVSGRDEPMGTVHRGDLQGYFVPSRPEGDWPEPAQVLTADWPRVELLTSHADATDWWLHSFLHPAQGVSALRGLVIAGTGNGTWNSAWDDALKQLSDAGVAIWVSTRCIASGLTPEFQGTPWRRVPWSPAQARVGLMLSLITSGR
jgi:L-asparaginase